MDLLSGLRLLQEGEWEQAHQIAEANETRLGAWLHGLVHLAKSDECNSRYWYETAGRAFPGAHALEVEMAALELALALRE